MNKIIAIIIALLVSGCAPLVLGGVGVGAYEYGKHRHHDNGRHEGWHH